MIPGEERLRTCSIPDTGTRGMISWISRQKTNKTALLLLLLVLLQSMVLALLKLMLLLLKLMLLLLQLTGN